ncbi:hypothetical protein T492DRAFT_1033741 [Pavlovales sp. CCMP2436]|nr:hypothetical protein T492DRAFT_1033741 [Pavlovales sp. CCMP2436]
MDPRPFEYAAGISQKRIEAELLVTGSNGSAPRQIEFDITNYVDTPNTKNNLIIISSNEVEVLFFASANEITRVTEVGELATIYSKIYRPVIRVCGSGIVSGEYTGSTTPVNLLTVLSNPERDLTLADFDFETIQSTKSGNAFFQGIYGQSANGTTIDILNSIERLDSKVFETSEHVDLVSCTATDDSWLVTTNNTGANMQCHVTPAYNLATINSLNKESPAFTNNVSIVTSSV